ncbi:MAG TPA: AI-2E family transporter [Acidiphilium sp.]|nr:AI-2E family transporter [Acidiphilium sp.]HQU23390.1 AI-2E family transporter [Acidiphilium sp.]
MIAPRNPLRHFAGRVLVVLLIGTLALVVWRLVDILVLLFGAILFAIGLCAAARFIARHTGMRRGIALVGVFMVGLVISAGALWIFGSTVATQLNDVVHTAPTGFKLVMTELTTSTYGREMLDQIHRANVLGATGWATRIVTTIAGLITRGVGYAVIALFAAIYLAAEPERYRRLCLRLVPPPYRLTTETLFLTTGAILERWLLGQIVVMITIGLLSGFGLWLLGIQAAFALGLMGGLLCFIPYVGAVLAAIPAVFVALTQGPLEAGSVILMYAGVHFVEGNFITPMVQAQATSFPPVLAILSTVAFSVLLGPLGMLLAAPLTLFLMAVIEILYVQHGLGIAPEAGALRVIVPTHSSPSRRS